MAYVSFDNTAVQDACKLLIQQEEYACKAPIIKRSLDPLIFFLSVWGKVVCVTTRRLFHTNYNSVSSSWRAKPSPKAQISSTSKNNTAQCRRMRLKVAWGIYHKWNSWAKVEQRGNRDTCWCSRIPVQSTASAFFRWSLFHAVLSVLLLLPLDCWSLSLLF